MSNILKPVTVPQTEHQVVTFSDFIFSWFFVHDRLVLTVSTLPVFRGQAGGSPRVILIRITHIIFSFVCGTSARYVFDRTTGACRIARPSFPVEGEKNRITHITAVATHKNRLPALVVSGYISAAPHKTGAGIGTPPTTRAHNRASGFFVRTVSPRLFRTRIMAGRTGPTSVGPGSLVAGSSNPVRLATLSLEPPVGEFSELTTRGQKPWQTASNSAPALSVFTSAAKSTADFSAQHASRKSCTSTCCMNARTPYQIVTARPSSAIWLKTWQNCKASSTSTDKPHPEAIPYLYAGGFRTSVTGGSHEER
ncbi:ash family protein [Escherichia coli]|nr:ash family protein [Escherichia coli]